MSCYPGIASPPRIRRAVRWPGSSTPTTTGAGTPAARCFRPSPTRPSSPNAPPRPHHGRRRRETGLSDRPRASKLPSDGIRVRAHENLQHQSRTLHGSGGSPAQVAFDAWLVRHDPPKVQTDLAEFEAAHLAQFLADYGRSISH